VWRHTWPGGYQYSLESIIGKTSKDIDANEVIWNFLKSIGETDYSRNSEYNEAAECLYSTDISHGNRVLDMRITGWNVDNKKGRAVSDPALST